MHSFMKAARLVLTPLAPLHVGLGEDLEPTNYVIHEGVLHAFDLARVRLSPELREELLRKAETANLGSIHSFIYKNKEPFLSAAHIHIPVAAGVAEKYRESLGAPVQLERDGGAVFNRNFIERTMCLAVDGRPYLPGSSVKGALRTAWLEALHLEYLRKRPAGSRGREVSDWEVQMLRGNFHTSPLRLLKIADFMPQCPEIDRKIVFACNYKKHEAVTQNYRTTRKEAILSGQYRAFASEAVLLDVGDRTDKRGNRQTPSLRPRLADIARHCNDYYRKRLDKETSLLRRRGYADKSWLDRLEDLLRALADRLDQGGAFLVRMGRYGDAETKTIAGLAQIRILAGKDSAGKGMSSFQKETTKFWLAAERSGAVSGLMPFGWALVETDPQEECAPLRKWCEEERRGRPDMRLVREKTAAERSRVLAAQAEAKRLEAENQARMRAEREAREREQAALSPEQRRVRDFCRKLKERLPLREGRDNGDAILAECDGLLESALTWPVEEQRRCAALLAPLMKEKNMCIGKRAKKFQDALRSLSGQEHG